MDTSDILILHEMLKNAKIRKNYERATNAGIGYTALCGINPRKKTELSRFARHYPDIYTELLRISKIYCPFPVHNFMVNKNYETKPHKDIKNMGESMIFSLGLYEGGLLVVDNIHYDTYLNPIIFDGSKITHYNTPITSGTKYSIVCYNS